MIKFLERIFNIEKLCNACQAKEAHISSLKDELRLREEVITSQRLRLDAMSDKEFEVIKHLSGMNRVSAPNSNSEMHSIPRHTGIQSRIAEAEAKSVDSVITTRRENEYKARISELLKPVRPEIEIVEKDDEVRTN